MNAALTPRIIPSVGSIMSRPRRSTKRTASAPKTISVGGKILQ